MLCCKGRNFRTYNGHFLPFSCVSGADICRRNAQRVARLLRTCCARASDMFRPRSAYVRKVGFICCCIIAVCRCVGMDGVSCRFPAFLPVGHSMKKASPYGQGSFLCGNCASRQSSYTKRTLSIQSVLPGEPMNAPPWLEANCKTTCVGVSSFLAHPVSTMGLLSPFELRA